MVIFFNLLYLIILCVICFDKNKHNKYSSKEIFVKGKTINISNKKYKIIDISTFHCTLIDVVTKERIKMNKRFIIKSIK